MPQKSKLESGLFSRPITVAEALELVRPKMPSASYFRALKSTCIDALRYAHRVADQWPSAEDVANLDIRELVPVLHVHAQAAAEAKGHSDPGDHRRRALRFTLELTGVRFETARITLPCPENWTPLLDVLTASNAKSEMVFLSQCCSLAGYPDAPRRLPSVEALYAAARKIGGEAGCRRLRRSTLSKYRTARKRLLDSAASDEERASLEALFAPLPTQTQGGATHLGVEPETRAMLIRMDLIPDQMTPQEMFRAIAPQMAADYDHWASTDGAHQSESYRTQCLETLLRVCGWVVRHGEATCLPTLRLPDLFLKTDGSAAIEPVNARAAAFLAASSAGTGKDTIERCLLEYLAEQEAELSLARSTVTTPQIAGRGPSGKPWFTHAVWQNCSRVWDMVSDVYGVLGCTSAGASDWAKITSRWGRLQKELSDRQLPAHVKTRAKDKGKLIRTVTLPHLVCVGLPLRRHELHALRADWLQSLQTATAAGHARPEEHPVVRDAADRYFAAAISFCLLSLCIDDGLRAKQYTRGRLGSGGNFRLVLTRDRDGKPIGIEKLTTWWTGDMNDSAHLKIKGRRKNKKILKRENREVRWGFVDRAILWDVISYWRPRQLVSAGLFPTLGSYDLEADLASGRYALFPSDVAVKRAENSRTDLSKLMGRELHYIVRRWLRTDLPEWDEISRDPEWRCLWAMHVSRLLIGSYWGGARNQWEIACYLTTDTETTLRNEYAEIDEGLRDRVGPNTTWWEHLNAYDSWMDRLYYAKEAFDPLQEPDLPLPPNLVEAVATLRESSKPTRQRAARGIRRARPGQARPSLRAPGS